MKDLEERIILEILHRACQTCAFVARAGTEVERLHTVERATGLQENCRKLEQRGKQIFV